jgi:iron complex outermembrane receptor protein
VLQQRLDDEALTWRENLYDDRRQLYFSAQVEF